MARLTRPEIQALEALRKDGVSFRSTGHGKILRFHSDFLVPSLKLAIFIDGCYWHACPRHYPDDPAGLRRGKSSQSADRARSHQVRVAEWVPVRVWECQDIESLIARAMSRARQRATTLAPLVER